MYSFATEYLTFPMDAEDVSWFQVAQNTVQANQAYRNINTIREQQTSDGAYFRSDQLFLFPQGQAGQQFAYMPGDTITDANDNLYKVISSGGGFGGSAFQLGCRLLGVQDFGHTTKYIRATSSSTDTTARLVTEEPAQDDIVSAIQPQARQMADEFGTLATPQTYKIWRRTPIGQAILAGDMFEDELLNRYEILAVSDRKRIDELSVYECVKKL